MREPLSSKAVEDRSETLSNLTLNRRYNSRLEEDPENGILYVEGSRPADESLALVKADDGWFWEGDDDAIANWPLYGRPFIYTVFDCFTFTRDFYAREFGIPVLRVPYEDPWWYNGENLIADYAPTAGFHRTNAPLQYGDLILFKLQSEVINHIAVYIGDGQIGHHNSHRFSQAEPFKASMFKKIVCYLRHEERA